MQHYPTQLNKTNAHHLWNSTIDQMRRLRVLMTLLVLIFAKLMSKLQMNTSSYHNIQISSLIPQLGCHQDDQRDKRSCITFRYSQSGQAAADVVNRPLVGDPPAQAPAFDLPRRLQTSLNRSRTGPTVAQPTLCPATSTLRSDMLLWRTAVIKVARSSRGLKGQGGGLSTPLPSPRLTLTTGRLRTTTDATTYDETHC